MDQYQWLCHAHYPFTPIFSSIADAQVLCYPGSPKAFSAHRDAFLADCRALDARLATCPSLQNHTLLYFTQSARYLHPSIRCEVRHLAGSVFAHVLFFASLRKKEGEPPALCDPLLLPRIRKECYQLSEAIHACGWIWLCRAGQQQQLRLLFSRDNDIPDLQLYHPVLALDVWEHAYWQDSPNDRLGYIASYFDCIDLGTLLCDTAPLPLEPKEA